MTAHCRRRELWHGTQNPSSRFGFSSASSGQLFSCKSWTHSLVTTETYWKADSVSIILIAILRHNCVPPTRSPSRRQVYNCSGRRYSGICHAGAPLGNVLAVLVQAYVGSVIKMKKQFIYIIYNIHWHWSISFFFLSSLCILDFTFQSWSLHKDTVWHSLCIVLNSPWPLCLVSGATSIELCCACVVWSGLSISILHFVPANRLGRAIRWYIYINI